MHEEEEDWEWRSAVEDRMREVRREEADISRALADLAEMGAARGAQQGRVLQQRIRELAGRVDALAQFGAISQDAPTRKRFLASRLLEVQNVPARLRQELRKANVALARRVHQRDARDREEVMRGARERDARRKQERTYDMA
jgi:hypothetical protein